MEMGNRGKNKKRKAKMGIGKRGAQESDFSVRVNAPPKMSTD